MLDETVAEATLDLAVSKANTLLAEVRLEERNSRQISIRSGQVNNITKSSDSGMNVRIVLSNGIGFSSSNRISRSEGARLVREAIRQAKSTKRRTPVSLS
jgi:predicted Zn-dependent protease